MFQVPCAGPDLEAASRQLRISVAYYLFGWDAVWRGSCRGNTI